MKIDIKQKKKGIKKQKRVFKPNGHIFLLADNVRATVLVGLASIGKNKNKIKQME